MDQQVKRLGLKGSHGAEGRQHRLHAVRRPHVACGRRPGGVRHGEWMWKAPADGGFRVWLQPRREGGKAAKGAIDTRMLERVLGR